MAKIDSRLTWYGDVFNTAADAAKEKALLLSAIKVQGEAKTLAPVDTAVLKNSIDYRVDEDDAVVGTNVEYAPYQEFGTRFQPGKPFLRPALQRSRKAIKNFFINIFRQVRFID